MTDFMKKLRDTKSNEANKITYYGLLIFFVPLGTATLMISLSNMLLTRCLGFLPDPEFYISSFSVARTLTILFMSPVSVITIVVTSFVRNKKTYSKVIKFAIFTMVILQIWFLILGYSPLSRAILSNLYNLEGALLDNAVIATRSLCLIPLLFFIRNLFLGFSIKLRNVKFATIGSFVRFLLVLFYSFNMPNIIRIISPEYIPTVLLASMVFVEACIYIIGVLITAKGRLKRSLIHSLRTQNIYEENAEIKYSKILFFALPLILSYSMGQVLPSVSQSALALSENKEIVLAVYSVSISLMNIIAAFNFQIPQLVVNHDTFNPINKNKVRNFCLFVALTMLSITLIIAFTPLGNYFLENVMKVSHANLPIAKSALMFGILYPASTVFMSYKRGKLIKIKKTTLLVFERVIGTFISLVLFLVVPLIAWQYGASAGILTLTFANFVTGLFTDIIFRLSVKKNPALITYS